MSNFIWRTESVSVEKLLKDLCLGAKN